MNLKWASNGAQTQNQPVNSDFDSSWCLLNWIEHYVECVVSMFCFNVLHYFSMCLPCLFIMFIDVQCVFVMFHCCFLNLFPYVPLFSWIFIVFLCNSLFSLVVQCVSWFFMFQRFSLFLLLFSMFLFFSFKKKSPFSIGFHYLSLCVPLFFIIYNCFFSGFHYFSWVAPLLFISFHFFFQYVFVFLFYFSCFLYFSMLLCFSVIFQCFSLFVHCFKNMFSLFF